MNVNGNKCYTDVYLRRMINDNYGGLVMGVVMFIGSLIFFIITFVMLYNNLNRYMYDSIPSNHVEMV